MYSNIVTYDTIKHIVTQQGEVAAILNKRVFGYSFAALQSRDVLQ